MTNTKANVTVFVPDSSVATMADEVANGTVDKALAAAKAAYLGVDSDDQVEVRTYPSDLDDAIETASKYAATTDGADILVILTDFECNDPEKAKRLVRESDDMFVLVLVSDQPHNQALADELDDDAAGDNNVDVVPWEQLSNPDVALAEVTPWLQQVGANA